MLVALVVVGRQMVSKSTWPECTKPMKDVQEVGLNSRAGPLLSLESRTPTCARVAVRSAISTQLLPEPPLYDDLNQTSSGASSGAVI